MNITICKIQYGERGGIYRGEVNENNVYFGNPNAVIDNSINQVKVSILSKARNDSFIKEMLPNF